MRDTTQQDIITRLSDEQLQTIYRQGTRRQYKDADIDQIVDRMIRHSSEENDIETSLADLRHLASSADSYEDFTAAIDGYRERIGG